MEGYVKISGPDPINQSKALSNLIHNLKTRTSGNNFMPRIDSNDNRAATDSCYETSYVQLGPLGDKMVITVDLSKTFFVHAVLVVQDLFRYFAFSKDQPEKWL